MRKQMHPCSDGLETRTLLSHLVAGLMAHHPVRQAEVQRVEAGSAMAVSLTTNQPTYSPGQVVQMSLTMTNTSNHNEPVRLGPSVDGFFITQNGKVIWRSNEGLEPQYIVIRILKPQQSVTLASHWTVPASVNGTLVVHDQMFPSGPLARFNVTPKPGSPPPPISPTPTLQSISRTPSPPKPILPILPTPIHPTPRPLS